MKTIIFSAIKNVLLEEMAKGATLLYRNPAYFSGRVEECGHAIIASGAQNLDKIRKVYGDKVTVVSAQQKSDAVESLPEESGAQQIQKALEELDPENDDHWTKSGDPDLSALKAILGVKVSRAEVDAIAPEFKRG